MGWLGAAVALKWLALPLLAWVGWRILMEAWRNRQPLPLLFAICMGALPLFVSYVALSLWTSEWTLQLHPPKFSQYARSAEFLPGIFGWFWELSKYHNQWFAIPLALAWAWIILRGRDFARSAETIFFVSLILTPMLHAWYFTWVIPFAVITRNRGAIFVTASAFVYFLLYHHVEAPKGEWVLKPWETALLWIPFVAGFLWSAWKNRRLEHERTA
jgi:alpha-1,6-mannosyltransferase